LDSVPPPSEPDRRISRIRLSSRWFTSKRSEERLRRRGGDHIAGSAEEPLPPRRVITMGNHQRMSARLHRWRVEPPTGLACRHLAEGVCSIPRGSPSTFLRSLRSRPITALLRYYGRCDSCPPGSSAFFRHEHRLLCEQVSLIHALGLPTILSPTTCGCSASPRHVTYRRVEPRLLPHGSSPNGNSGLRHSLAGSPHHAGRIEFLIVRTGRSPPAAPHPVSRRRSCSRLQVALTWRELSPLRPSTLSDALGEGSALPLVGYR